MNEFVYSIDTYVQQHTLNGMELPLFEPVIYLKKPLELFLFLKKYDKSKNIIKVKKNKNKEKKTIVRKLSHDRWLITN